MTWSPANNHCPSEGVRGCPTLLRRRVVVMDPPDDAVETATSFYWVYDGILYVRNKGIRSTGDTVIDSRTAIRDLMDGAPLPMLNDLRGWPGTDPEGWTTFVQNIASVSSAVAFVVDAESSARLGPWPEAMNRLLIPFQVFTEEAEALAFLQGFLPSE